MNGPPPQAAGYPDWQAYASWRSGSLLSAAPVILAPGNQVLASFAIQNFASVRLRVEPTSGYGTVKLQWFADSSFTDSLGFDTWNVSTTTGLSVVIPAQAGYAQLSVNVTSAGQMKAVAYLAGDNTPVQQYSYQTKVLTITQTGVSLAAGADGIYPLKFITRGWGTLTFTPADATGKLALKLARLNPDSSIAQVCADYGAPTAQLAQRVPAVDDMYGVWVHNSDGAAAHGFDVEAVFGLSA